MERKAGLLVADLDDHTRRLCNRVAEHLKCDILVASDRDTVLFNVKHNEVGVVLLDTDTISQYLDLLREIKKTSARIEVVIADERPRIATAVEAIKAGATNYLGKPLSAAALECSFSEALHRYRQFQATVVTMEELEKQAIEHAIAQAEGDKLEAARLLSIGKTTLYRKLKEYGTHSRRRRG